MSAAAASVKARRRSWRMLFFARARDCKGSADRRGDPCAPLHEITHLHCLLLASRPFGHRLVTSPGLLLVAEHRPVHALGAMLGVGACDREHVVGAGRKRLALWWGGGLPKGVSGALALDGRVVRLHIVPLPARGIGADR